MGFDIWYLRKGAFGGTRGFRISNIDLSSNCPGAKTHEAVYLTFVYFALFKLYLNSNNNNKANGQV